MLYKTDKSYKESSGIRLDNVSFLNMFNVLFDTEQNDYMLNIFRNFVINEEMKNSENSNTYYVDNADFWENISYNYYDNEKLWWTIALNNDVYNPFEELNEGEELRIIKERYILELLKDFKNISEL